jgi:hypothetical protein
MKDHMGDLKKVYDLYVLAILARPTLVGHRPSKRAVGRQTLLYHTLRAVLHLFGLSHARSAGSPAQVTFDLTALMVGAHSSTRGTTIASQQ